MIKIITHIEINAPIHYCFDRARDIELHTKTVWKHTKENSIGEIKLIEANQVVTFEATHFLIRQQLTSKITEYNRPYLFIDEMQRGAFKKLKHIHEFEQHENKTMMKDTLMFEAPLGILGWITERLILKTYMRRFIEHRNKELKKIIEKQYRETQEITNK